MAIVTNLVTPSSFIRPYARAGDAASSKTLVPRGEIIYKAYDTIAAQLAADQTVVLVNVLLDDSFCYRLHDATLCIKSTTTVNDYYPVGHVLASGTQPEGANDIAKFWELNTNPLASFDTSILSTRVYRPMRAIPEVFRAPTGSQVNFSWIVTNVDAASQPAMEMWFNASFLMYDLEQYHNAAMHTPLATAPQY